MLQVQAASHCHPPASVAALPYHLSECRQLPPQPPQQQLLVPLSRGQALARPRLSCWLRMSSLPSLRPHS